MHSPFEMHEITGAFGKRRPSARQMQSGANPAADKLPKFNGDVFVQRYNSSKIFMKRSVFPWILAKSRKHARPSRNVENP